MMAIITLSLPSTLMLRKAVKPKLLALSLSAFARRASFWVDYYINALQGWLTLG